MPELAERRGGPHLRGAVAERHALQRHLPALPASARLARITARVACRAWRVPDAADSAALVASELVTAALRHVPRGRLTLRVLMTPRRLRIEVHEPNGAIPPQLTGDPDARRSTQVIDACSARWGVEPRVSGPLLFAELPLT